MPRPPGYTVPGPAFSGARSAVNRRCSRRPCAATCTISSLYVRSHGGGFYDDTGDPELTIDMYGDGDHLALAARGRYTDIFFNRLQPLFQ